MAEHDIKSGDGEKHFEKSGVPITSRFGENFPAEGAVDAVKVVQNPLLVC